MKKVGAWASQPALEFSNLFTSKLARDCERTATSPNASPLRPYLLHATAPQALSLDSDMTFKVNSL